MFNKKYDGMTAKEWYKSYIHMVERNAEAIFSWTAYAEEVEVLKAKLELLETRLAISEEQTRQTQESADCQLRAAKETAMRTEEQIFRSKSGTYCGLSIKGWFDAHQKLDQKYLETKKQLDLQTKLSNDAMNEIKRQDKVIKSRNEQIDVLTGQHSSAVDGAGEIYIAESRLTDCEEKLGKSEADLQLEKMKYAQKCLELANRAYEEKCEGFTAEEWHTTWKLLADAHAKLKNTLLVDAQKYEGRTAKQWKQECDALTNRAIKKTADLIQTQVILKEAQLKLCDWELRKLRYQGYTAQEWHASWLSLKNKDVPHVFSRLMVDSDCQVCGLPLSELRKTHSTCPGPKQSRDEKGHLICCFVSPGMKCKYCDQDCATSTPYCTGLKPRPHNFTGIGSRFPDMYCLHCHQKETPMTKHWPCPGPKVHVFVWADKPEDYICTGCGQLFVYTRGTNCPGAGAQVIFNQL